MEEVVRINNLTITKRYKADRGINHINLSMYSGEIFGIFGSKGSGKNTILQHLIGQIKADGGNCSILSMDVRKMRESIKEQVLYIPEAIINYQVSSSPSYFEWLMNSIEERKILFLEEPFVDLDTAKVNTYKECIKNIKQLGKTICISSESYTDLECICDRIAFIHRGQNVNTLNRSVFDMGQERLYRISFHQREEYITYLTSCAKAVVSYNGQYKSLIVKIEIEKIQDFLQELTRYDVRNTEFIPYTYRWYFTDDKITSHIE